MKSLVLILLVIVFNVFALPFNSPQATAATTGATVKGKVITWGSSSAPAAGCKVELFAGPFGTKIGSTNANSKGEFTFTNVKNPIASSDSFYVKASVGYHKAAWYFSVGPGGSVYQVLKLSN